MLQLDFILRSELTFPVLECIHLLGLVVGVGTIAVVDFRLLNIGLTSQKTASIAATLSPWTITGLGVAFLGGAGLYMSDPDMYYLNRAFQLKMIFLLIGLIFHFTVHQKAVYAADLKARWVGAVSLLLWTTVIAGGIFIGFTGDGE